jgi:hypothetical protein
MISKTNKQQQQQQQQTKRIRTAKLVAFFKAETAPPRLAAGLFWP